ncbi:MAG: thioredoxin domain-containing protein, partial [Oscillospiraceae bacterium]|nr:thioredoxin domain-containing protein [Oscillospiraceae bacterium]
NEKSPYLRQHAENPVDWYPWGEEAFEKAKREDKPVFLSIGYATCHWCHVMAHESFEDPEVAAILNERYVPVKVDREERPDVDSVYMQACIAANGSGGWPLTAILTPEQEPFFVGTYFPKESRGGRMGLKFLLTAIAEKWETDRGALLHTAEEMTSWLRKEERPGEAGTELPKKAAEQLMSVYDEEYGGFGRAPKFPTPHNLIFLMEYAAAAEDGKPRAAVEQTLRQMLRGGICDHFGGGFCRYSTDREWLKPHFEKTLYDNALMALCLTEAWQDGHMARWRDAAEQTLDYCLRELKAPDGGFYSGQDADSEGQEGAYYLFTPEEVCDVLGAEAGKHFCECYDITAEGNFEGKSIPNLLLNNRWNFVPEGYEEYREKLREYREKRMPLFTDTKILAGWNGLMLMALSRAAHAFKDRRYLLEAQELAAFMLKNMCRDGRLMARLCEGELRFDASLSDHAFTALGLLELYAADFDPRHILEALSLASELPARFADPKGGYFDTPSDGEKLLLRPKETQDGALPCGNSVAAQLFVRLFRLTAEEMWRVLSQKQLAFIGSAAGAAPAASCAGLTALLFTEKSTRELTLVLPTEEIPDELKLVTEAWAPNLSVLLKTPSRAEQLAKAAPFTAAMEAKDGRPSVYVCENGSCQQPVCF